MTSGQRLKESDGVSPAAKKISNVLGVLETARRPVRMKSVSEGGIEMMLEECKGVWITWDLAGPWILLWSDEKQWF